MKNIWNDPRSLFNGNHFSSSITIPILGHVNSRSGVIVTCELWMTSVHTTPNVRELLLYFYPFFWSKMGLAERNSLESRS